MLRWLANTWRVESHGIEERLAVEVGTRRILALWHGSMLLGLRAHRDLDLTVLVSMSDDGSLVVPLLRRSGYRVVRGSSSRGGTRALRRLLSSLGDGGTVVITPDGPRGPRHRVNLGLAWLARESGLPIVPLGFVCDRAWRLRTWDRFVIPKPGAQVVLVYGEPIHVDRRLQGEEELRRVTERIRSAMLAAEAEGRSRLGAEGAS